MWQYLGEEEEGNLLYWGLKLFFSEEMSSIGKIPEIQAGQILELKRISRLKLGIGKELLLVAQKRRKAELFLLNTDQIISDERWFNSEQL